MYYCEVKIKRVSIFFFCRVSVKCLACLVLLIFLSYSNSFIDRQKSGAQRQAVIMLWIILLVVEFLMLLAVAPIVFAGM